METFQLLTRGIKFKNHNKSSTNSLEINAKSAAQTSTAILNFFNNEDTVEGGAVGEQTVKENSLLSVKEIRRKYGIKVYGSDVSPPIVTFDKIEGLSKSILANLKELKYVTPTPIQMQSIPIVMDKREVLACAPTGSGKTMAFLLPMLQQLKSPSKSAGGFRALIITPTRELAQQIHREFLKISNGRNWKVCILSKATNLSNPSVVASLKGYDVLISTPMRLVHAINQDFIKLNRVEHIILDEADKLLELGFLDQVDEIFAACTCSTIQRSLFSATISSGVEELAKTFMKDPIRIVIGQKNSATTIIDQKLVYVGQEQGKLLAIRQMVQEGSIRPPTLIFVESITRAKELFHELVYDGINVDVIHAERTQAQRDLIISNFRTGKTWVLIATDLMARGLDFKGIQLVVNYDFPQTPASYIHRIGRTGRAGRPGTAVTFFTKSDGVYLKSVVNVMREAGCEVAPWMLTLKAPSRAQKRDLKRNRGDKREKISTISTYDNEKRKMKDEMILASTMIHH